MALVSCQTCPKLGGKNTLIQINILECCTRFQSQNRLCLTLTICLECQPVDLKNSIDDFEGDEFQDQKLGKYH